EGGTVTITINDKEISVADTGIGISPEHMERIYERFYRVDKSRAKTVDGTGLGLSIVKHIAMQNNGKIAVESRLGEGSTFTVSFSEREE
ncbi:MAG: ATP-binding protein, partial [Eubacteriales bacterium]|nr:ATP-binding protein [Eubacteriales bacterium]